MAGIAKHIFLQALNGRAIKGRVLRLMAAFNSFEEFMAADKTALMKADRKTKPGAKRGLGERFFRDLDLVRVAAYDMVNRGEDKKQPRPTFTVGQLKAVTTLMELCGIERIDLEKIVSFLETMGVKI